MSRNDASRISKNQPADAKAEKSGLQISRAYSTPRLVVLGQAYNLVQGSDLYKMIIDPDRRGYHD